MTDADENDVDDDMVDKISSSPSIDDGKHSPRIIFFPCMCGPFAPFSPVDDIIIKVGLHELVDKAAKRRGKQKPIIDVEQKRH